MSTYDSNDGPRRAYQITLFALSACAVAFHFVQNSGFAPGGTIALPKLVWLAYALLFWYLLPALFLVDARVSRSVRRLYLVFLANMLLRAMTEGWMIYVSLTWHPQYGIAHNVFSILLIQALVRLSDPKTRLDNLLTNNAHVVSLLFVIEVGFVLYMIKFVSSHDGPVYFVPGDAQHAYILFTTWLVVGVLTVYLWAFSRRWLYART